MSSNVHYINEPPKNHNLAATFHAVQDEFWQFLDTRVAMLQSEIKEKLAAWKASVPMLAAGALIVATAFLVLTGALICLLRTAFGDSPYAWFLSFLIVGVIYAVGGASALLLAVKKITTNGLVPECTIKVLKEDKAWLQNEMRTQL